MGEIDKAMKRQSIEVIDSKIVLLAGNPNVGKSTLFNSVTGMDQHTGNWTGKTVDIAYGDIDIFGEKYRLVDLPGTYSLMSHSKEEEVSRDYICFGKHDGIVVVCDAACLERNLNLVLQIAEIRQNMLVCLNLCDEAKRKGIKINTEKLSELLGADVVETVGRRHKSVLNLVKKLPDLSESSHGILHTLKYSDSLEAAIDILDKTIINLTGDEKRSRFLALRIIEKASGFEDKIDEYYNKAITSREEFIEAKQKAFDYLLERGYDSNKIKREIAETVNKRANSIFNDCLIENGDAYSKSDRFFDKLFCGKYTAVPCMLVFLSFILWLTIVGANYPSEWLSVILGNFGRAFRGFFETIGFPEIFNRIVFDGAYNVLSTVISVMLPPMAIFFPLFTLLEDAGYLPRIAFNLDKPFRCCDACGKQALTMCMGYGCNAAGVIGTRIIDSPRERLIAVITNSFSPCNGRFPFLIAVIAMFFGVKDSTSLFSSLILCLVIVLSIIITFIATKLLSVTLLKGETTPFILELPPYRRPQFGKVIVRSLYERTLRVLGRAVVVAVPAGVVLWILANVSTGDKSLLILFTDWLDPIGKVMGLDGVILIAFILGLPANEIVLPIIIMCYTAAGTISDITSIGAIREILVSNGWTYVTAVNVILFSIMHWPCSTTLITIKRETNSLKWTFIGAVYPTLFGIASCVLVNLIAKLF